MFSNLSLYYLKQIGITPWIIRRNDPVVTNQEESPEDKIIKLVVVVSSTLNAKAKSLLKYILTFINLNDDELLIINESANSENDRSNLGSQSPLAVLALGSSFANTMNESTFNCPIFSSMDLNHYIANPTDKKRIFKDLMQINNLLAK